MTIQSTLYKNRKKTNIIIIIMIIIIIIWGVQSDIGEEGAGQGEMYLSLFELLITFCMRVMICTGSGFAGGHSEISIFRVL